MKLHSQESGHKLNSGKYSLMLFLLLLADKREREAIAIAREYGNYCTKEQNKVIDELLQGTKNKDEEAVIHILRNQIGIYLGYCI